MYEFPPNAIGAARCKQYSNDFPGLPLEAQLGEDGIAYRATGLPHLIGMGGAARLVSYTSPRTGQAITVLVTPHAGADDYAETYYYFEGLTHEGALALGEQAWLDRYDVCRRLQAEALRGLVESKRAQA
jgi:hypothetical protein